MNRISRAAAGALAGATIALLMAAPAQAAPFADPLDTPAMTSALAPRALLNGLAHAGKRIVAVGQRGHVLYSDDQGGHWTQARVPVSTDLVALVFPTEREGWAVGHDGVVLHSADAGATWERQFDGRKDAEVGDKPLLDIWFDDHGHGLAVGAFGLVLRSDDGGKSWQHWESHLDNPKALHLNAIRAVGGELYIVGEQGLILKRGADGERFEAVPSPYQGSFFGVTGSKDSLLVFGLRGTALHSADGGKHWERANTGTQTGLTAGLALADGSLLLVSQAGQLLHSADGGATFQAQPQVKPGPASAALLAAPGQLLIAGARGARLQALTTK
ncbi:MAG TPA: YCF48-related protein [Burkholderiaceae bacterium]|nr:YCF48-related protein [Burkholderiaceae bacterium]